MRVFNPSSETQTTEIKVGFPFTEISQTNILEQDKQILMLGDNNSVTIEIPSNRIYTLRVK